MLTSRTPPIDESVRPVPGTPLPIMRPLTPVEVASVSLTGMVDDVMDGSNDIDAGGPIVTAYTPEHAPRIDHAGVGGPFEPLFAGTGDAAPFEDGFDNGFEDELTGDPLPAIAPAILPATIATPVGRGTDMLNVETAVLDALRAYGAGGPDALHEISAACWRAMRGDPTVRGLQYCHVFDLVSAEVVDPADPGEFAPFAVGVRLRAHRELVPADMPADYAAVWRGEAGMVVAAMDAH